jgi:hypothetical protein
MGMNLRQGNAKKIHFTILVVIQHCYGNTGYFTPEVHASSDKIWLNNKLVNEQIKC